MNSRDKDKDPAPESAFAHNNQPNRPSLIMSNDPGAGANAGPAGSLFSTRLPPNTLSELVWSPFNGTSSVALVPLLPSNVGGRFGIHERGMHLQTNGEGFRYDSDTARGSGPPMVLSVRNPNNNIELGTVGRTNEVGESSIQPQVNTEALCTSSMNLDPIEPGYTQAERRPGVRYILSSREKRMKEAEAQRKMCMDKRESASDNDMSRHILEVEVNSRLAEEAPLARRKGKEKALSGVDIKEGLKSKDKDSDESVESCNSAKSVTTGTKRQNFAEGVVDDGRGVKKRIGDVHGIQSLAAISKRDSSSFINWISNMMKGYGGSIHAVTPQNAGPSEKKPVSTDNKQDPGSNAGPSAEKPVSTDKNQEPGSKPAGFQSIFQSLYSSKEGVRENRVPIPAFHVGEGSKEAEPPSNAGDKLEKISKLEAEIIFQTHARNINAHMDFEEGRRPEECPLGYDHTPFSQMELSSANRERSTLQRGNEAPRCEGKHDASELAEREGQTTPPLFATGPNPSVPEGLFDAVRRLRLSRHEIMTWMTSRLPVSLVEGYFIRIRLGQWEEGLGGTGYHVACIIGMRENTEEQDGKFRILVKVGGLKCYIDSQFVSNSDFLEDELLSWWSISTRDGDRMPSLQELRAKIEAKPDLGS